MFKTNLASICIGIILSVGCAALPTTQSPSSPATRPSGSPSPRPSTSAAIPPSVGALAGLRSDHDAAPMPNVPKPGVGAAVSDPVFKTTLVRITDAAARDDRGTFPDYSKRQAWNADESLLLLRTGLGNALLFDGASYRFIKALDGVEGEDVFWHPTNPDLILYNPDNTLYSYDVRTGQRDKLFTFTGYAFANTGGEGNLSRDGRYYAIVGKVYNTATQEVTPKDLLVLDVESKRIIARQPLPALEDFDWVSISPSGNFIVANYADTVAGRFHGVEVYDRNFRLVWQKGLGLGHSDLALDTRGGEALVFAPYDEDRNVNAVKKFRLADGGESLLLDLSAYFALHISCQNEQRSDWCLVSTYDFEERLTDDAATWLPFEDEVFALKLDGSGEVERIAHHHSRRFSPAAPDSDNSNYFAEPHATLSRAADRILFGSNWREHIPEETSVDAYVVTWK